MPDDLTLSAVDAALRGGLVMLLAVLALTLWRDRPRSVPAQACALLALGLSVSAIGTMPALAHVFGGTIRTLAVGLSLGNAVLFALFARALFNDAACWRPWQGMAWLAVTILGAARCAGDWPRAGGAWAGLGGALDAVPLVCSAWVVAEALARWRDDLVERRRRLRRFVAFAGCAEMLAMLWLRGREPLGHLSVAWASIDVLAQLVIAGVLAANLLRLRRTELFPLAATLIPAPTRLPAAAFVEATSTTAALAGKGDEGNESARVEEIEEAGEAEEQVDPHEAADGHLADALARLMNEEQVYREEGLTVATLARRLAVPEYRLRRVIRQRLGHRHFSNYVNGLRLADVRVALADPARRAHPVLTIALEAGFQSIGPFNRAFKADTGLTPTEFRQRTLAGS